MKVSQEVVDVVTENSSDNESNELSPKQLKRIQEQKEREEKKMLKRQAKAMQKEQKAFEKEMKLEARERRAEEERKLNEGLSAKEMEQQQRLKEEEELFQKEFLLDETNTIPKHHKKKSAFDSNRLGIVVS